MHIPKHIRHIKVLMYHQIVEKQSVKQSDEYSVCVDDFRKQLRILEALNFTPITFLDYKLYLEDKLTLPKKPIILTFDDGYLDTFELALPVLLEFDMRAVIFVMGNRDLLRADWDEKGGGTGELLMTNEQILKASSFGFEIGAHSMNHRSLTELNEDELKNEVLNSKKSIESILDKRIHSFSYPYGCTNQTVRRITRECGFTFGCGVYTGPPGFGENFYDFRRLTINEHTGILQFLMYLVLPYQYVEWMYARFRHQVSDAVNTQEKRTKQFSLGEKRIGNEVLPGK